MGLLPHDPRWTRLRVAGSRDWLEPDLVVRRYALPSLRPGAPAFRLAFFSDLHWRGEPARRLSALLAAIASAHVDAVIFGGDLAAYLENLSDALDRLAALETTAVRLAVPGNRESVCRWLEPAFWRERYARAGFRYLHNETWLSPDSPAAPAIVGLDDLRHGNPDLAEPARAAASGRPVVTVTHNPDVLAHRGDAFLGDLVLSGHTHGGQYRVPGWGAVFTSSSYGRQFDHGWRQRHPDGPRLYITAGAGETGPSLLRRRLFCPAELVLITLDDAVLARGRETP